MQILPDRAAKVSEICMRIWKSAIKHPIMLPNMKWSLVGN